jgi:hypothetical protein
MQKETLDQHYRRAMVLFSAQNVEKCVVASETIHWSEFNKIKLEKPSLKENRYTVYLDFASIKLYI